MLDLGFPLDARHGDHGSTPLHAAAYAGSAETVRLLLARGADIEARDITWDSTPLEWAKVGSGLRPQTSPDPDWAATVRILLDAGASTASFELSPDDLKPASAEVADILIAVVDGLKGFPEAINAAFPETVVQTCIVHLIRHSLDFASWKDRKSLAQALRTIYRAADAAAGQAALDAFAQGPWGAKYPAIAQSWRRSWELVIPFFAFPEGVRRIIYTTDEIDKSFLLRALLLWRSTGDHVAKSRDRGYHPGRAAITVAPHWRHPCAAFQDRAASIG